MRTVTISESALVEMVSAAERLYLDGVTNDFHLRHSFEPDLIGFGAVREKLKAVEVGPWPESRVNLANEVQCTARNIVLAQNSPQTLQPYAKVARDMVLAVDDLIGRE